MLSAGGGDDGQCSSCGSAYRLVDELVSLGECCGVASVCVMTGGDADADRLAVIRLEQLPPPPTDPAAATGSIVELRRRTASSIPPPSLSWTTVTLDGSPNKIFSAS